jgi:hypothetical protein
VCCNTLIPHYQASLKEDANGTFMISYGSNDCMNDITLIKSHLKSLEAELQALKARMGEVDMKPPVDARSFGQLYAVFRGQSDSTEEEIDAVLYRASTELRDEG